MQDPMFRLIVAVPVLILLGNLALMFFNWMGW